MVHPIANRTARPAALAKNGSVFNIVAILRCPLVFLDVLATLPIYAVSLFINIPGFGEYRPVLEGPGLKRKIFGVFRTSKEAKC